MWSPVSAPAARRRQRAAGEALIGSKRLDFTRNRPRSSRCGRLSRIPAGTWISTSGGSMRSLALEMRMLNLAAECLDRVRDDRRHANGISPTYVAPNTPHGELVQRLLRRHSRR